MLREDIGGIVGKRKTMGGFIKKFFQVSPNWLYVIYASMWRGLRFKRLRNKWIIQTPEGMLIASPTPKWGATEVLRGGFSNKFERFFKIERGDTVLDVGACIGDTTIPMAIRTGSGGFVIAVEPNPTNLECFKFNLRNFKNVKIVGKAVSNKTGIVKMNVHKMPAGHSLINLLDKSAYIGQVEVECDTLDNIVGDKVIDFAKIDVQGVEIMILEEGASKFLRNTKKVVVETHHWDDPERRTWPRVVKILKARGYETRLTEHGVVHAWKKQKQVEKKKRYPSTI
jgi:FkbM family methyltransferase